MEKGDLVLITGVNGYIASHIANEAVAAGYRVRGTVRDTGKAQWMQTYFDKHYGAGKFELVVADSFEKEGALDGVIDGKCLPILPWSMTAPNESMLTTWCRCCGDSTCRQQRPLTKP
jgi:nucleoside-diphosphate-sugar epimerase